MRAVRLQGALTISARVACQSLELRATDRAMTVADGAESSAWDAS